MAASTSSASYLVALPFASSIALLIAGDAAVSYLGSLFKKFAEAQIAQANAQSGNAFEKGLPLRLQPGPLRQRFEWGADAAQFASTSMSPLIALFFFLPQMTLPLAAVLGLLFVSTAFLTYRILNMEPGEYQSKGVRLGRIRLSHAAKCGIILNLFAAAIVTLILN